MEGPRLLRVGEHHNIHRGEDDGSTYGVDADGSDQASYGGSETISGGS